ncbi:MAG: hypothetical protein CUN49_10830 [Candidatus Thermofonsia Clade 1 bacterium]|uniref:Uncharacterized protein n=1 Tax=Candidatus Thermofonsia Clade 1 bacterium TaxID=2364210 RepID=A0A2M8PZ96_9CHLR|nr:MAG: hypothetical protein CUN49_10830 [Candidatus Thermofonsia Clade 1 bacterium]PJF42877.1 MAG: hypothetical protein CUN50_02460 [Candidatus Thermofonsia Clade 1 bacterium]RMF49825.1 MAG: hypothetical protein D6749_12245 [Chloroflexota bacterium]
MQKGASLMQSDVAMAEKTPRPRPAWRSSGSFFVILMFIGAALLFIYSLWFVNTHSPVEERFNQRRRPLEADTPGYLILRERAGDYLRTALNVDTLDAAEGRRHGVAEYNVEGKTVRLEVEYIPDQTPTLDMVFAGFLERADGTDTGSVLKRFPEARTPYYFAVFSGFTYTYYEFGWINGNWILRASSREAGQEALLRFVNGYVY